MSSLNHENDNDDDDNDHDDGKPGLFSIEWFPTAQSAQLAEQQARERNEPGFKYLLLRVRANEDDDAESEDEDRTRSVRVSDLQNRILVRAIEQKNRELETLECQLSDLSFELESATRALLGLRSDVRWSSAFSWRKDFDFEFHNGSEQIKLRVIQNPVNSPVGFVQWEAGFLLANVLLKEFGVAGRNNNNKSNGVALELGCGCGLIGMVLAHLGFSVCFTDQANTLPIVRKNLQENRLLSSNNSIEELNWGDELSESLKNLQPNINLIVGSELLYTHDQSVYEKLRDTIDKLSNPNTVLYMVYEDRGCNEASFFQQLLRRDWQTIEQIQETSFHPGTSAMVHLYKVSGHKSMK